MDLSTQGHVVSSELNLIKYLKSRLKFSWLTPLKNMYVMHNIEKNFKAYRTFGDKTRAKPSQRLSATTGTVTIHLALLLGFPNFLTEKSQSQYSRWKYFIPKLGWQSLACAGLGSGVT